MANLFLSFAIAIGAAIGLVVFSTVYDLEFYTSKMLPLIPILYALSYHAVEHLWGSKNKPAPSAGKTPAESTLSTLFPLQRILFGIVLSFLIKFVVEISLVALFLNYSGQSFSQVYGKFGLETIGTFLRGDHPWLSGNMGVYMLALISLISCFGTGLWIGYTSKGNAMLEGVITGAGVTVIMSMTNMLVLYQNLEEVTVKLADLMGYAMRAGFIIVIALQVLLYGLWSGLVQMGKEERAKQKLGKKGKK